MNDILSTLNDKQREAVLHDKGPLLILAGAGSGKTKVITHRIAYLIGERGVNPYNILAITFTNKAAKEMRERVDRIVGEGADAVWVSTFHSTCVRILRRFIESIGYSRNFTIYDTDDQKSVMRDIIKYMNLDPKKYKERAFLSVISSAKDELIGPDEFYRRYGADASKAHYIKAYYEYEKRLKAGNALDFDDLIMKTVELFKADSEVLAYYRKRFKYIMVDEYQDTNTAQFEFVRLLATTEGENGEEEHNLCVVGDDDQSIYKFRGANIENILNFENTFEDARVIKLEQNYRSTKKILGVANEVIHHNVGRKDKSLWTENADGETIVYTDFGTDLEEASGVVSDIEEKTENGGYDYRDMAILYRTNNQSRLFEERLVRKNIPYRLIGGVNFYQRKEIKDMLAYLRVLENGRDDVSVKRIINVPKRGIGQTTIDRLSAYATDSGISFYDAVLKAPMIPEVARSLSKIEEFSSVIEKLKAGLKEDPYALSSIIDTVIEETEYEDYLDDEEDDADKVRERMDNIGELINKLKEYSDENAEDATLSGFLEEVALIADIDSLEEDDNRVVLMTLHSAKGLEFPVVYMVGMEEGMFPSRMCLDAEDPEKEIEEERRLCYVGITRAERVLMLSSAHERMLWGSTQYNKRSRFIDEIPRYMLTMKGAPGRDGLGRTKPLEAGSRGKFSFDSEPFAESSFTANERRKGKAGSFASPYADLLKPKAKDIGSGGQEPDFGVGDQVKHIKFGVGTVKDLKKGGRDYEVTVEFPAGVKKMLLSFANLKKI